MFGGSGFTRYRDSFDKGPAVDTFDISWTWTVVGAPPGATVSVESIDGDSLPAAGAPEVPPALVAAVLVGGVLMLGLALRGRRRGRPRGA